MPKLPELLMPVPIARSQEDLGFFIRLAMMTAMLSVCFDRLQVFILPKNFTWSYSFPLLVCAAGALFSVLSPRHSRLAIALFSGFYLFDVAQSWSMIANHGWLAAWSISVAVLFRNWWQQPVYADYLRITLGVVMLAAASQKLFAGTYLDGSYIAYLSYYGSTTENMFIFLCSEETLNNPCGWHKFLGAFIVLWQICVGLLLLAGVQSLLFLTVEIGFLIGAGVYADEMNFQVLNIALLCIAFRVGMSYSLFALCVTFLILNWYTIARLIYDLLGVTAVNA